MKKNILHISADFPDSIDGTKTKTVAEIVQGLDAHYSNFVVSINRTSNPLAEETQLTGAVLNVRYFSPPKGLLLFTFLDRVVTNILRQLRQQSIQPELIMAHKFSLEGYIAWRLSKILNIPYALCFMGNTDRKIYSVKRFSRALYAEMIKGASRLVFSTPWAYAFFKPVIQQQNANDRVDIIPYIVGDDMRITPSAQVEPNRFVTICRLNIWRLKNIHRILSALKILQAQQIRFHYDIIGYGDAAAIAHIQALILEHDLADSVSLLGSRTRDEIDQLLPKYQAYLMPSYPESFGLVYLEALRAGVPIMCAKNSGIAGFFASAFPGVLVGHDSIAEISQGISTLIDQNSHFRALIAESSEELELFSRASVLNKYRAVIDECV